MKRLRDVEATHIEPRAFEVADRLRKMGWQQGEDGGAGFGDVQPRYVYQVPLATARWTMSSRASTSCGAATSRRPRRPASRSSRAATTTWPSGSGCTRSRPCATTSGPARSRTSSACGRPSTPRTPTACGCTSRGTTGEPVGGDHAGRRRARLVLLRRLRQHRARGPALERDAVADAARRATRSAPPSTTCAASATRWTRPTTSSA